MPKNGTGKLTSNPYTCYKKAASCKRQLFYLPAPCTYIIAPLFEIKAYYLQMT